MKTEHEQGLNEAVNCLGSAFYSAMRGREGGPEESEHLLALYL